MYSYIRFDTQYAVWISCHANVAPKSNLIQLGSTHERSGVWTGPYLLQTSSFNLASSVWSRLYSLFFLLMDFKDHGSAMESITYFICLMTFKGKQTS